MPMPMSRRSKRPRVAPSRAEGLEPRALLASGLNLVMQLGEVSRAAALEGVEVAASIAPEGSITFAFQAEASGTYLLKVRHTGEGLTLEATGPAGSASINPGPAGPFSTLSLPLKAGDYRIKASATEADPVFVDWELLLTTGVGQSAAIGSTLAAPSGVVPLPGLSTAIAPSASPASSTPPAAISPAGFGPGSVAAVVAAGKPIGLSDPNEAISPVGPTSGEGDLALAFAGNDLPAGALKALGSVAEEDFPDQARATPLLSIEALGDNLPDLVALGNPSWLERMALPQPWSTPSPADREGVETVEGPALAVSAPIPDDRPGRESEASMGPARSSGLIASGVILAAVARRWRPGKGIFPGRKASTPAPFPPSQPGWIGRPMSRMTGPKSRAWARRLQRHT